MHFGNCTYRLLTKATTLLADKDLFSYSKGMIGLSITTNAANDEARMHWEPRTPSIQERLDALNELSEVSEIKLWVSAEPFLPGTDFKAYFDEIFANTGEVLKELVVGKMNYVAGVDKQFNWGEVVNLIESYRERYPKTRFHYKKEFVNY